MKSSKVPVSHGKRKLSTASVDGMFSQVSVATRRTRSSSNADNVYTQRLTRSTQNNAFFELPNNYGSRKHQSGINELNDTSPIKRAKRSSSSSSSTHNISTETDNASPPMSKRKKLQNSPRFSSTVSEKENLELFNDQSNEEEDVEKLLNDRFLPSNKCLCTINDSMPLSTSSGQSDEGSLKSSSEKIILNGHNKCSEINPVIKIEITPSCSVSKNINVKDSEKNELKSNDSFHDCLSKPGLLQKNSSLGILRKRHYSENEIFSTRRIRRLSERGEMASVMEFFFNHKRPCSSAVSSSVKRSKQVYKRSLRNSTLIQSPGFRTSEKSNDFSERRPNCNGLNKSLKLQNGETQRHVSPLCGTSLAVHQLSKQTYETRTESKDTNRNSSNKDVEYVSSRLRVRSGSISKRESSCDSESSDIYSSLNGAVSDKVVDGVMEEVGDVQDNHYLMNLKKRSLRSSGAISPDHSALGLDLITRRRRKHISNCEQVLNSDLYVMSDSEIDLNKKSSIESCISCQEKLPDIKEDFPKSDVTGNGDSSENESTLESFDNVNSDENTIMPSSLCRRGKGRGKGRDQKCGPGLELVKRVSKLPERDLYEPPPLFDKEPPIGSDVYYFESDHVALKQNADYYAMLRSASVLEAQRKQALKDLEILQQQLKNALKDPISFVDNLQQQREIGLPRDQTVASLPIIDWSKYISPFGTFENVFSGVNLRLPSKPFTRQKRSISSAMASSNGQATNKARSHTFRKSWTVEEQRKLEELLIKYPQEAVEFNRFRKIASELGNRTPLQVQSRVQKYFIKLAKAGLPIPGRMPRLDRMFSCKRTSQRHRTHHQVALTRISTFFSNFHIPVKMNDDDEDFGSSETTNEDDDGGWDAMKFDQVSDEEDVSDELRFSDEYLEILQLKRQRKQQLRMFDRNGRQVLARHHGYQCDLCQSSPIEGVRYHCIDCPESESVDLCQSCIRMQNKFETDLHKNNHRLEPVYAGVDFNDTASNSGSASNRQPFADVDYTKVASSRGQYNYLDPNFLPPSG